MDAFISRKKRKTTHPEKEQAAKPVTSSALFVPPLEDDDTDIKLATLASLFPHVSQDALLDTLISADGSVEAAVKLLQEPEDEECLRRKNSSPVKGVGYQSSLSSFGLRGTEGPNLTRTLTKRGQTLHLYSPEDIAAHTPCSIIHNFLPTDRAESLLKELLEEAKTFPRQSFKLFDREVQSPHSACFYVGSVEERERQKTEYVYNGSNLTDIRQLTPQMIAVSNTVKAAVNDEIVKRINSHYPRGKKLKHQSPEEWLPNAAFVNCYAGGAESVGYHSDQLTYLGPRAVIGSLSLGVSREFRVRKIVAKDDEEDSEEKAKQKNTAHGDAQGQIAIHLPHNSLLVMHAEMQEEWKHSIHPAPAIDPHPISGNRRINITYRMYRHWFHPKYTPRCKCNIPCVLRCVQRKKENRGRYTWMCHANYSPGKEGCSHFQWAEFDDDGYPPWAPKDKSVKYLTAKKLTFNSALEAQ